MRKYIGKIKMNELITAVSNLQANCRLKSYIQKLTVMHEASG